MHRSQVFLFSLISFVAGIGMRSFVEVDLRLSAILAALGSFLVIYWFFERSKIFFGIAGIFLVAFSFGIMRFSWHTSAEERATVLRYAGEAVTIRGIVEDIPDEREKNTRLLMRVSEVISHGGEARAADGRVLVFVNRYPSFQYGDEIRMRGTLEKPESFSGFDYPSYLMKDGIYALMYYPDRELLSSGNGSRIKRMLFAFRGMLERSMENTLPEPHSAFLKGILLGSRASIPSWLLDAFQATGVIHIIALSGFNITIIADNISRTLRKLTISPGGTFWVSLVMISLFTIMVGASPSIVRASLMGVLVLLAIKEGRRYQGPNALTFAGALMILHNPAILRFDVAFQLSFLATVGLLWIAPRMEHPLRFLPEWFNLRTNAATTLSAQLAVLPLLAYQFGAVSVVGLLSNMLILSFMPLTMFWGFLAALMGMIWIPFGILLGGIPYAFISYHIFIVQFFSAIPFAMLYLR